ncbi:MAG: hypothetical protein M5U26_15135 [Planctomycetota bacterium]|nr:hypothetical protein [Planctomycetota bacterium]
MADQEDEIGWTLCVYAHRGLPPDRQDFTDLAKAEKAFEQAKSAAILFQTRPPIKGLGWVKLKQKDFPTPAPAAKPEPAAKA